MQWLVRMGEWVKLRRFLVPLDADPETLAAPGYVLVVAQKTNERTAE